MLLFYIRHGDPVYDPDTLTPLGFRQAEAVARRLARYGLDEIYVSSSNRAQQTCKPTCELLKKEAVTLDWTNEKYAFAQEKMSKKEGGERWCFQIPEVKDIFVSKSMRDLGYRWQEHPFFQENPVILEGYLRIQRETRNFLKELGFEWDEERGAYKKLFTSEKRIALFAHQGFGTNFFASVLDLPWPQVCLKTDICHSSMTVIKFNEKRDYVIPKILTLSNDSHLLAENLPTCYNNEVYF